MDLDSQAGENSYHVLLPRVTIKFCTQCKWMLRAAYYAQELLSTFSTALGEVALQPATGGIFTVEIQPAPSQQLRAAPDASAAAGPLASPQETTTTPRPTTLGGSILLWDRKVDGGFPETKELKRRVRDVIEPGRDLGHVDRDHRKEAGQARPPGSAAGDSDANADVPGGNGSTGQSSKPGDGQVCEDCA
ncbi:hypothetical protein VTK73DRAFT_1785 [Phialemonium thermophilum]|uniref:Uncharacterized protein n=1 Tax=Phialemonium thermophilum TaxID=223376 RepID=A0ABR3X7S4_9PEZI